MLMEQQRHSIDVDGADGEDDGRRGLDGWVANADAVTHRRFSLDA